MTPKQKIQFQIATGYNAFSLYTKDTDNGLFIVVLGNN